jgi:hypothetical protein
MPRDPSAPPLLRDEKLLAKLVNRLDRIAAALARTPEVVVDIAFEDGVFFVVVENVGTASAYNVSVRFKPPLRGLGGEKAVSEMPLFRRIPFMPPGKRIRTVLDTTTAYFASGAPTAIAAGVVYADKGKRRYADVFHHDLAIYRDVGYLPRG